MVLLQSTMEFSDALILVAQYGQNWSLVQEASDEELRALGSAATLWLREIEHVIQSRPKNTLRLRDREVTRTAVQGTRSFQITPRLDTTRNRIPGSNNNDQSISDVFPHLPTRDVDIPISGGAFQDAESDHEELSAVRDYDVPMSDSSHEGLFIPNGFDQPSILRDGEPDIDFTPHSMFSFMEPQETIMGQSSLEHSYPAPDFDLQHRDLTYFHEQMEALNHIEMDHTEGIYDIMTSDSSASLQVNTNQSFNKSDAEIAQYYLDCASKIGFRPLYPENAELMTAVELRHMFEPLFVGTKLTKKLIYNLLLALLPMPLILEPDSDEWTATDETEGLLATIDMEPELSLILVDRSQRTLFAIGTGPLVEPLKSVSENPDISFKVITPGVLNPNIERSLDIVHLATHCSQVPLPFKTSCNLRMQFIKALLRPYQHESILNGLGIKQGSKGGQKFHSFYALASSPDEMLTDDQLRRLSNNDITRPPQGVDKRVLRLLQYIFEIGSPAVLDAIKTAATHPRDSITYSDSASSCLLQIHRYLDTKGSNNHLDIARTRYLKYCYHESFQSEVRTLTLKKRVSRLERRRKGKRLYTSLADEESTPETNWITNNYPNVEHGSRSAHTIVRLSILQGIRQHFGGTPNVIEKDFDRYLRDGSNLQKLLQGADPILLILFPGERYSIPVLNYHNLEDIALKQSLQKPIGTKNIDRLTDKETGFFGRAMHLLRPELFNPSIMSIAIRLIHGSEAEELQDRDPNDYATKPLEFLA